MSWWIAAGLCAAPLPAGVCMGWIADAALGLRELRALSRRHPGGIPADAVPWHLRGHVTAALHPGDC